MKTKQELITALSKYDAEIQAIEKQRDDLTSKLIEIKQEQNALSEEHSPKFSKFKPGDSFRDEEGAVLEIVRVNYSTGNNSFYYKMVNTISGKYETYIETHLLECVNNKDLTLPTNNNITLNNSNVIKEVTALSVNVLLIQLNKKCVVVEVHRSLVEYISKEDIRFISLKYNSKGRLLIYYRSRYGKDSSYINKILSIESTKEQCIAQYYKQCVTA